MYSRGDKAGWDQSNVFKKAFSVDVEIEFIGVWYVISLHNKCCFEIQDAFAGIRFAPSDLPHARSRSQVPILLSAISVMLSRLMNAVPNSRRTIGSFCVQVTIRERNLERCRGQISVTLTMTAVVGIINTRAKSKPRRNPTIDCGKLMCWKFGLLGVTVVPLLSSG
jgi:hypothetical protein